MLFSRLREMHLKFSDQQRRLLMVNKLEYIFNILYINKLCWIGLADLNKNNHYWCGVSAQNIPIGASLVKSHLPPLAAGL